MLRDTSKRLHLVVNFEKSKVVIFRNGGYIAAGEKWFYDTMKLKIVNHYKYLAIIYSTGTTFSSYTLKDMSDRARKGVLGILRLLWRLGEQCPKHCIDTASDSFGKTVCNMERKKLYEFRQRLIDCCLQDWYCAMALNDWYAFYSSFFFKSILLQITCLP